MNRTEQITKFFTHSVAAEQFNVCLLTPEGLMQLGDATGSDRFGWAPPVLTFTEDDDILYLYFVCPHVIAEQTEHLSDSDLNRYLEATAAVMHAHVVYSDTAVSERIALIDNIFAEHHQIILNILSNIQMDILDRKATT